MIPVILTWIWILICSYLWGHLAIWIINRILRKNVDTTPEFTIILGIGVLAIYAETFSLFSGVGLLANLLMLVVDIFVIVKWREVLVIRIKKLTSEKRNVWYVIIIIIFSYISMTYMFEVVTYDTGLYHSQAVQWIEEYGVVPGLGNLHHRFAYNSAIMCLHALFSMKFLFGQQLHCVNGFMFILFTSYAVTSMKFVKNKRIYISDFLRVAFFVYYNMDTSFSSLGSDLISLCLVIYIVIKYVEGIEDDISNIEYYCYLSILALIAVSFKLSVALIVLIVIYPAYMLIKDKNWKLIIKLLSLGVILTLPFLIRNIIISGYIVYPFPKLDLFSYDWKMNKYVCLWDAKEVKSWGQGVCDAYLSPTFREWFEIWINRQSNANKCLFFASIIISVLLVVISIVNYIKEKDLRKPVLSVTVLGMLIYWFAGAPLMRYGIVFTIIPVLIFVGLLFSMLQSRLKKITIISTLFIICIMGIRIFPFVSHVINFRISSDIVYYQVGHEPFEFKKAELEGVDIYIPENGDRIGDCAFPSTPYINNLELIELRGNDLTDGFRIKKDYKNACFNTYGCFIEPIIFE